MLATFNDVWHDDIGICSNGRDMLYDEACAICCVKVTMSEEAGNQEVPEGLVRKLDGSVYDASGRKWK